MPVPPVRKKGTVAIVTSPARTSMVDSTLITLEVTWPWLSMTPFGAPVVPDVKGSRHRSSNVTGSSIGSSGAVAISRSVLALLGVPWSDGHRRRGQPRTRNVGQRCVEEHDTGDHICHRWLRWLVFPDGG